MKLIRPNASARGWRLWSRELLVAVLSLFFLKPQYSSYVAAAQEAPDGSPGLGSIDDYTHRDNSRAPYLISELGVEVLGGNAQLDGTVVHGAVVIRVYPDGPAAQAGLLNEQHRVQSALLGAFILGSFFFPPAFLGTVVVSQSQIGEAHDTIIAVDSERVENVEQLEHAIAAAKSGQIIYLTVVRANARRQIRILSSQGAAQTN